MQDEIIKGFDRLFPEGIRTIDSHTAGEPTRLVVQGIPAVPGRNMAEKRSYLMQNLDHFRKLLTREPRGHGDLLAAVLLPSEDPSCDFGLVYMDGRRYPYLCGHATIGAVATLLETGALQAMEPETAVCVDTPSGPMQTRAKVRQNQVEWVAIQTVPSFVYALDEVLQVPGLGEIQADTVCVGGFFVMVDLDKLPAGYAHSSLSKMAELGMSIIDSANDQLEVKHPLRPEVNTVDVVEFYQRHKGDMLKGSSLVVYGEAHVDRSPCGTGTAAKLTLMRQRNLIQPGQEFRNQSPTGTFFQARIIEECAVGDKSGVVVEIKGSAYITGSHLFVLDSRDPFPEGFLV